MAQRGLRWLCACAALSVSLGEPAHTRAAPGKWAGKEDTHVPQLIISPEPPSLPVRLVARATVPHSMSPEHHIDEIYVKDQTGAVLGKTAIGPTATAAALSVEVPPISVRLAAFAHCNQHGTWQARAGPGPSPPHLCRGLITAIDRDAPLTFSPLAVGLGRHPHRRFAHQRRGGQGGGLRESESESCGLIPAGATRRRGGRVTAAPSGEPPVEPLDQQLIRHISSGAALYERCQPERCHCQQSSEGFGRQCSITLH